MDINTLRENWERLGANDPLWAVLTHPTKKGNRWDEDQFFKTGEEEIAHYMNLIEAAYPGARKRRALDFGCGVGRLTFPLTHHFTEVTGVDVARSMIEKAKSHAERGDCRFVHNTCSDLKVFPSRSFDLVLSLITLQHMAPRFAFRYIRDIHRLLARNGVFLFQLPEAAVPGDGPSTLDGTPVMEMHGIPRNAVLNFIDDLGFRMLAVIEDVPINRNVRSYLYLARKPGFLSKYALIRRRWRRPASSGARVAEQRRNVTSSLSWLGEIREATGSWIEHERLGMLYTGSVEEDSLWIWSAPLGWIWTSRTSFPNLYRLSDETWVWFQREDGTRLWFYSYGTKSWESFEGV